MQTKGNLTGTDVAVVRTKPTEEQGQDTLSEATNVLSQSPPPVHNHPVVWCTVGKTSDYTLSTQT